LGKLAKSVAAAALILAATVFPAAAGASLMLGGFVFAAVHVAGSRRGRDGDVKGPR
jgi:hypothetical protein